MNNSPSVNFTGLDGCRSFKHTQRYENTGVSKITNTGVHDCREARWETQRQELCAHELCRKEIQARAFLLVAAQKRIVNTKKMKIAAMRFQSARSAVARCNVTQLRRRLLFDSLPTCAKHFPEHDEDDQPKNHAHARRAKAPVPARCRIEAVLAKSFEALALRQKADDEWRQQGANVDAHVEDRKTTVATWIVFAIKPPTMR